MVPVIGLSESDHRLVAHGAAARAYGRRALIRLRAGQDRAGPDASTTAVERIWRFTGLAPEECDLLVDAGDVCCPADVRTAEPRVRHLLDWARRHAWRSVTVAAGGMPPTLSRLPTDEPVQLDRWDWQLWRRLADAGVDYGDYGVHPAVPGTGDPGDRLPTVRYTDDGSWWVYRWARRGGRGDDRFADLCRTLVSAPHWPTTGAAFSWGDHELLRRARRAPAPARPPTGRRGAPRTTWPTCWPRCCTRPATARRRWHPGQGPPPQRGGDRCGDAGSTASR